MTITDTDTPETVPAFLDYKADQNGDETFLVFRDQEVSYAELRANADRVARNLRERGIERGDTVALFLENKPTYLYLWFGIMKAGAVMVTLNTQLRRDGLVHNLSVAEPEALVVGADHAAKVSNALGDAPDIAHVFSEGGRDDHAPLDELFESSDASLPPNDSFEKSDSASIIFTSGTTGQPKGVLLPHYAYVNTGRQVAEIMYEVETGDRFFNCLPLYHCNAQMLTVMAAMYGDVSVALEDHFSASKFLDWLRKYDATIFNFLGMMLKAVYKQDERPDDADNPARIAFGVPIPEEIWEECEERFGLELLEAYGATETGCACASGRPGENPIGACGLPWDDNQIRIVDDQGDPLPPGEVGEIVMRPGQANTWFKGYYNNPEATVEAWQDLWLHLDDLGYVDEDGWLYFVGRKSSVIRHRGENIAPTQIENVLESHPGVDEAVAVGIPSEMTEEDVMVFVVGSGVEEAELVDWCRERLAEFKIPRYVSFVDEIPKTATNKIRRTELRDRGTDGAWDRLA